MRHIPEQMRPSEGDGATTWCLCWVLTRRDSARLGFTEHDMDLRVDGVTCRASSALEGGTVESASGLVVDSLRIDGALDDDAIRAEDVAAGLYDGAVIDRWLVDWRDPGARLLTFRGAIGEISRRGESFNAEIEGLSAPLNRPIGRVYLKNCDACLGDSRCRARIDQPGMTSRVTVTARESAIRIRVDGLENHADGWFAHGRLTLEGGATAVVLAHRGELLDLAEPISVAPGDSATLTVGCDGSASTCQSKFDNLLNFQGFPHLPGDEWITSYPAEGDLADGGSRNGK